MMHLSFERKIVGSFLLVSLAFAILLYAFYHNTKKIKSTTEKVKQSQEALRYNEQILSLSLDIGFGSREYLLTGNEKLLAPFNQAVTQIQSHIAELRWLTLNNANQQRRIDTLEVLTKERIAFAETTITLRNQKGMEEAIQLVNTEEGRYITDATRLLLNAISTEELQLLEKSEAQSEASMGSFEKVLITLVVFIDVILILVGVMVFQKQKIRQKYEDQLRQSNAELESFSYMVSHDLRSPVHATLGLMEVVKKKYEPVFEPELKELFGLMQSKSQRMNAIIEDLLALARHGKEKLKPEPADMKILLTKVWNNINLSTSHKAKLEVSSLPVVLADISMMEQVLENLCSNAIKYSSRKENPVVKVGYKVENSVTTFFIKDNGAGFDMKNYGRLFKAFQRLHHASEFAGTGVGLLLVKRIIEMHQGKIWAESKPGEGASFYFTLPSKAA